MIAHEPRSLGYYGASRWFQGAVLFAMLGSLALGLLWALADAKERTEKLVVELTVRNMRSGMQLAMGEALMQQRANEIATWVGNNPMLWLGSPPGGYRGECSAAESRDLDGGAWCFERDSRQLVYRPHSVDHLRVPRAEGGGVQCDQLSWRVMRAPDSEASGGFVGLRIEPASSCRWVLE